MAQETAVHRWDAAHAVGQPDDIDAVVAADGIDEFLTLLRRTWSGIDADALGGTVHLHCTDTARRKWFVLVADADGITFTREHAKGDVAIRGTGRAICSCGCGAATPERSTSSATPTSPTASAVLTDRRADDSTGV